MKFFFFFFSSLHTANQTPQRFIAHAMVSRWALLLPVLRTLSQLVRNQTVNQVIYYPNSHVQNVGDDKETGSISNTGMVFMPHSSTAQSSLIFARERGRGRSLKLWTRTPALHLCIGVARQKGQGYLDDADCMPRTSSKCLRSDPKHMETGMWYPCTINFISQIPRRLPYEKMFRYFYDR